VLSQGNAQRNLGSLFFSGLLSDYMSEKPVYTLTARAADLEVNDLLRLAGQKPESLELTGTLSTEDIQITGEGAEVRVREPFTLTLEGATIKGLPIDNALAKLFYDNQKVQIQEAQASLAAGALRLEGTISREGALDLTLLVQDEDLARLTTAFSEGTSGWQGRLDARARILGTMDDPRITLNLNAEEVAFNAFAFGDLQGAARFQEKRLTVENFTLLNLAGEEAQGGRFEIPDLMYDIQSRELKGRANWSNVMLPRLRDLLLNIQMTLPDAPQEGADWSKLTQNLYNAMAPLDGATTGNIQISGSDRDPQIALHWEDTDLTLDRYPVTLKQGSAQINAQSLMIPHLTLTTEDGKIEGKITKLEFGGEIEAELTALGFNLNFLRHWLSGEDAPRITGTGTIGIAATGKTASPDIRASVNVNEVRINDIAFDHVNLDDISLSNGVIQSESLSVIKGRTIARGTGKVEGFVWEAPFLPKTAKTSFTLELLPRNAEDQNLPIISEFAPGVLDPQSSGQFALRVGITGTVENPLDTIQGSLTLKASRLQIPGFATGLSNVDGELRFDGDRVTVERFQGATKIYSQAVAANQNVEAPFTLSGSLPHGFGAKAAAASPEDGIRLQSRKTQFRESPLPGTKSGGVRGIADVSLLLSGSLKQPFLSGIIDISEANLILPRDFGTPPSGDLRFPVDPKLDVTVRLGRDVRLTSSQLNARTDGSVNLNGSLASPGLSGQLTLREGQLIFPTARFNLLPEGRIRVAYPEYTVGPTGQRGEPELSLVVDVQAQTTLSAVSLNGTPRLYQITATARGPLTGTRIDLRTGRPLLNLQFATNPPDLAGSQAALTDRVLGLLGGDALQPSGRDTGQSLTEQVTSMFTGSVLSGVLDRPARSLGFDTLALSVGGGQNLNFSVSRRIFGPLYISYDRSLSAVRELYILRASLRFRNNYQVSYEVNERNEQRGLLEGIWRF
jgi:translocation and assembly module TamB